MGLILQVVTALLIFGMTMNCFAEAVKWYEHPGYWFKNVFYSPANGSLSPEIKAVDLKGNKKSFNDYSSQYILLSFWASWCPPCMKELPQLEKLESKYSDNDFKVLALNVHDTKEDSLKFIEKHKLKLTYLLDIEGATVNNFAISPIPTNFLIHKESNKIIQKWQGKNDVAEIELFLNDLIRK